LPRQVIKTRFATGLPDFPFLRGSHLLKTNISPHVPVSERQLPLELVLIMASRLWSAL
jgi:hypothetical protein